jgi:hypothetical protein
MNAEAEQQRSIAVIDVPFAAISGAREIRSKIAQEATWDDDRLRAELTDLLELGFDVQLTGFDSVEIDRFPPTRLSAGCGFRKETIAGMRRNGRDAPSAAIRGRKCSAGLDAGCA